MIKRKTIDSSGKTADNGDINHMEKNMKKTVVLLVLVFLLFFGAVAVYLMRDEAAVPENQEAITEKDMENLKVQLEKEQPEYVAGVKPNWSIDIIKKNGRYILATLLSDGEHTPSYPGFRAFKADDGWKIIFSGQESPDCSLVEKYSFPADIVPDCWRDGKTWVQRNEK